MGFDKKEMIEQLEFEIAMMEKGGSTPLSGNPATIRKSSRFDHLPQRRPGGKGACLYELLFERICAARSAQLGR